MPPVYLVGNPSYTSNVAQSLMRRNVNIAATDHFDSNEAVHHQIVMLHADWLRQNGQSSASDLDSLLARGGTAVVSFGDDAGNALSATVSSFLTSRAAVYIGQTPLNGSTPVKNLTPQIPTDVSLLTIFTIGRASERLPTYTLVYQVPNDPDSIATGATYAWNTIQQNLPSWTHALTGGPFETPHSLTSSNGFTSSGSIGWLSAQFNDCCGSKAGVHQVLIQYYYTSQSSSSGTYYWFLNYVQHYTTGYCTTWSACFIPTKTIEYINAHTNIWPGQVLWQANPTGSTCNPSPCGTITYSLSVANTGASAGVTYSVPSGTTLDISYLGDGTQGTAQWTQGIDSGNCCTTYSLEPSVIYELDPTKAGGVLPLVTSNKLSAWVNNWAGSNQEPDIDFGAYVNVDPSQTKCTQISNGACVQNTSQDATANVEIDACPTTDIYGRSAGLAVDKSLPTPWWPSYYYGYEFGTYSGCFTYNTSYSLPRGSNSLELGISGFCPSYCWSATIKVNGNQVAQGNVDRNSHLTASFSL